MEAAIANVADTRHLSLYYCPVGGYFYIPKYLLFQSVKFAEKIKLAGRYTFSDVNNAVPCKQRQIDDGNYIASHLKVQFNCINA